MSDAKKWRFVGYARVSTEAQVDTGQSLPQQGRGVHERARRGAQGQEFKLEMFEEEGKSGRWTVRQLELLGGPVRPVLSDAIDRAIEIGADAFVVDYVDRMSRDMDVWRLVKRLCLDPHGISLWVASGDLDLDDPNDQLTADILARLAEEEVRRMSRRALRTNQERRAAGCQPWGDMGYGWRWETEQEFRERGRTFKGMAPIPQEGHWVKWIAQQYVERSRVMEDLCRELNDREVPFRGSDKPWHAKRVRDILDNPHHGGLVRDNDGNLIQGAHFQDRYYDPDVYYAIQDIKRERSTRGARTLVQEDSPLLGVLRCGRCGRRMQLKRASYGRTIYYCPKPQVGESRECPGLSKRADIVERYVRDAIGEIVAAPRLREMVREEATSLLGEHRDRLRGRRRQLRKRLAGLDDKLDKWGTAYTQGNMSEAVFLRLSSRWENERSEAEAELADVERKLEQGDAQDRRVERVMHALDSFQETWERMDAVRIRNLLIQTVEGMTLEPDGDGAATLRLKCYYMPEVAYSIPHLRNRLGEGDGPLAQLTITDLAFLALWNQGKSPAQIAEARGIGYNSGYGQMAVIRRRTGIDDIDKVAQMAQPLIDSYRKILPVDCKSADNPVQEKLEPTDRQVEVAQLCAQVSNYAEAAARLHIVEDSVAAHMYKLRQRLGVDTNREAFLLLAQQGKLHLSDDDQ